MHEELFFYGYGTRENFSLILNRIEAPASTNPEDPRPSGTRFLHPSLDPISAVKASAKLVIVPWGTSHQSCCIQTTGNKYPSERLHPALVRSRERGLEGASLPQSPALYCVVRLVRPALYSGLRYQVDYLAPKSD